MRNVVLQKIGLLDHMGYGNLGDAAIQEAVIANIKRRLPNAQLVGFSLVPDDTTKRHGILCYPVRWSYPSIQETGGQPAKTVSLMARLKSGLKAIRVVHAWMKYIVHFLREVGLFVRSYRRMKALDLLIISGGGQLGELWRGPWSHPFTIFKFSLLSKLLQKRLYFLDVGAGPLEHPLSKFFARWAVRLADYRSFRDNDSKDLVASLGVKAEMYVYPDPAYALEVEDYVKSAYSGSSTQLVGLNPIGFCDPRIWPRENKSIYQEYLDKLTRFSVWLLEHGYTLRVFTTETSVDRHAVEDLKERLRAKQISRSILDEIFRSPSESVRDVLKEMSEYDFIVTSKFHGIIFSHLLGKPVISLSYHRKMDAVMRAVGQGRFCADIERFEVEWLIKSFCSLIDESTVIKSRYAAAVVSFAASLSQQFDSLFGTLLS